MQRWLRGRCRFFTRGHPDCDDRDRQQQNNCHLYHHASRFWVSCDHRAGMMLTISSGVVRKIQFLSVKPGMPLRALVGTPRDIIIDVRAVSDGLPQIFCTLRTTFHRRLTRTGMAVGDRFLAAFPQAALKCIPSSSNSNSAATDHDRICPCGNGSFRWRRCPTCRSSQ